MSNTPKLLPSITVGTTAVAVDQRSPGSGVGSNYIHKYASVQIQADPANSGKVYVGDNTANFTATNYIRVLNAGDWFTVSGSAIDATKIFVLGSASAQVVHVGAS